MSANNKQIATDVYQRIFGDLNVSAVAANWPMMPMPETRANNNPMF
jgi:hypothetical protein